MNPLRTLRTRRTSPPFDAIQYANQKYFTRSSYIQQVGAEMMVLQTELQSGMNAARVEFPIIIRVWLSDSCEISSHTNKLFPFRFSKRGKVSVWRRPGCQTRENA